MPIRIHAHREDLVPRVRDFNRRIGGAPFPFPEAATPEWLPPVPGRRLYQHPFLAVEDGTVRGGYLLKMQDFSFGAEVLPIGYYHSALSEAVVDPKYAMVGGHMLADALRRSPLLYALGMGGFDRPLPRMLRAMGWSLSAVPFHFRVVRPARFLRHIQPLRTSTIRRAAMDAAAVTGLGWAGVSVLQSLRARRPGGPGVVCRLVESFGAWADDLWRACHPSYPFIAVRDSETLQTLYPAAPFLRLQITRGDRVIGWAVLLDTAMQDDKYFGDLRVGSIIDCLAQPEDAAAVLFAATQALERRGVDLIVSNQGHSAWCSGFRRAGFLSGPTNFIFAASKALAKKLPESAAPDRLFLMRGDGDGPIHL